MNLDIRVKKTGIILGICLFILSIISLTCYATGTIDELETESDTIETELSEVNEELLEVNEELESLNQMIELTEAQMGKTLEELAASKVEEATQYENMKIRIRYMYESGESSFLALLFQAEDIVDFINKTDFINNVMEYDRNMLLELISIREEIEYEEANILDEQVALVDLQAAAELKSTELQDLADELEIDLEAVQAKIAEVKEQERLEAEAEAEAQAQAEAEAEAEAQAEADKNNESNSSQDSDSGSSDDTSDSGDDYTATTSELDLLAALLDCEASADYDARLAVATVIMNRVASSKFPNTVYGVIYQSGQFSPTWTGKLDRRLELGASDLSYQVAEAALAGTRYSPVSDCYYFLYAGSTDRTGVNVGGNLFFSTW